MMSDMRSRKALVIISLLLALVSVLCAFACIARISGIKEEIAAAEDRIRGLEARRDYYTDLEQLSGEYERLSEQFHLRYPAETEETTIMRAAERAARDSGCEISAITFENITAGEMLTETAYAVNLRGSFQSVLDYIVTILNGESRTKLASLVMTAEKNVVTAAVGFSAYSLGQ